MDFLKFWSIYLEYLNKWAKVCETASHPIPKNLVHGSPCKIVLDEPGYFLLRMFPDDGRDDAPHASIIFSPEAGHTWHCVDLDSKRSLAATVHRNTSGPVYVKGAKSATLKRKDEGMDEVITANLKCRKAIGKPTAAFAVCAGGYPALITEALYPGTFSGILLINSPVDFKIDGGPIQETLEKYGMSLFENIVRMGNGLVNGKYIVKGFISMNFQKLIIDGGLNLVDMIMKKQTEKLVKRESFRNWYYYPLCHEHFMPGRQYLQIDYNLFWKNELIKGIFLVHDKYVDLANVRCPVGVIYGEKDDITLPRQASEALNYIGSSEKASFGLKGGHFSFASETALNKYYREPIKFIDEAARRWQ